MTELSDLHQDAITTVREFFAALEIDAVDEVVELVTDDIEWINVSLPAVRGKERFRRALELGPRFSVGFAAHIHHIAGEGDTVLTERTDVLRFGPVRVAFWVCGTFEMSDGKIAVWRDYFSWLDILRGTAVGVVQAVLPRRLLGTADA